ncbi:MAG: SPFH domain-containing protein [Clostridia bacterium]|nr:SPFH domain-containing protein [Clostridia bacterium]
MLHILSMSGETIAGIVGCIVIVIIVAIASFLPLYKKKVESGVDFIEFHGDNSQLLQRVDISNRFTRNTTLIVPPTHAAIVIKNGGIVDVYESGEHILYDKQKDKGGIRSLIALYISKTVKITVRWGTKEHQRIDYIEPILGKPVSVGAFGVMDVRVSDPKKFYLELVANFGKVFSAQDLQDSIRTKVVDDTFRAIGGVLNESKLSYMQFTSAKYDIQSRVSKILCDKFTSDFGFTVSDFIIENINVTQEQLQEIKGIYEQDNDFERSKSDLARQQELDELKRGRIRKAKEAVREDAELDDFIYNRSKNAERDEIEYERKLRFEDEDWQWSREDKKDEMEESVIG